MLLNRSDRTRPFFIFLICGLITCHYSIHNIYADSTPGVATDFCAPESRFPFKYLQTLGAFISYKLGRSCPAGQLRLPPREMEKSGSDDNLYRRRGCPYFAQWRNLFESYRVSCSGNWRLQDRLARCGL